MRGINQTAMGGLAILVMAVCVAIFTLILNTSTGEKDDRCAVTLRPFGLQPSADKSTPDNIEKRGMAELCQQVRMAEAAEDAADTAWWQFIAGLVGLAGLGLTVVFTAIAARAARDAAKHADRGANIANQTLLATQRPWVSCNVGIASSLVFKEREGRVTLQFMMKNFGSSPAINVRVEYTIVTNPAETWDVLKEITEKARTRRIYRMLGHKIFPGDTFIQNISAPIERQKIDSALAAFGVAEVKVLFAPAIVGCVVYNSTFNNDNHTTEFLANFGRRDPEHPNTMLAFDLVDGEYKADQISLQLSFGSGRAD